MYFVSRLKRFLRSYAYAKLRIAANRYEKHHTIKQGGLTDRLLRKFLHFLPTAGNGGVSVTLKVSPSCFKIFSRVSSLGVIFPVSILAIEDWGISHISAKSL